MPDLLIKEVEVGQLNSLLSEVPMKYGVPIVNFLNHVAQKRVQEENPKQEKLPITKGK